MLDPRLYHLDLPASCRPPAHRLAEKIHDSAWAAAGQCTSARRKAPNAAIRLIVIHATAGSSTEGAVSVMRDGRASFHWIVPDENEPAHENHVWATAPERRAAWHVRAACFHPKVLAGARRLNGVSLGVEIVNAQSGGDGFSGWQIAATADIVRYAWAKYPGLAQVVSHARLDPGRRTDPGANFPWEDFTARVLTD